MGRNLCLVTILMMMSFSHICILYNSHYIRGFLEWSYKSFLQPGICLLPLTPQFTSVYVLVFPTSTHLVEQKGSKYSPFRKIPSRTSISLSVHYVGYVSVYICNQSHDYYYQTLKKTPDMIKILHRYVTRLSDL